jgi:hypothetical protein
VVADAARNQLTNSLVAEKARRLLGPSVAMRFADIILPDAFFYAYKADGAPLREKANAVLYCNWNWKSFGREERKLRERETIRLSSSSGLPSPNCYFCGHFLAKMPLLFPPTQPLLSRHTASDTRAHKKNDPGFTSLTASQSFL